MKYCKKCQADTDRNTTGACKPCARSYAATWRVKNPQSNKIFQSENRKKIQSYKKKWYLENKVVANLSRAQLRLANPEKASACDKKRYEKNKKLISICNANKYKDDPDKFKGKVKSWQSENKDLCRAIVQNRRARELNSPGKLSKGLSIKLFELQKGKCPCCMLPLGNDYHLDHIMPLALGGSNADDNIQLLRQRCNNQKNAKHPIDFMQSRGFLI